jgi:hypothetical protein
VDRVPEPTTSDESELLLGWLAFHRDALMSKCEGLAPQDLVRDGLGGSKLSLLGLVRHLTEMERVYFTHCIEGEPLEFVYGPYADGGPEGDLDDLTPDMVAPSLRNWDNERERADLLLGRVADLAAPGPVNGRTARWCLLKVIQEYARHNGHADLIRQSIDGAIGE